MQARVWWVGVTLVAWTLSACGSGTTAETPPAEETSQPPTETSPREAGPWVLDVARGEALYIEKCQGCHQQNGSGGYGPALTDTGTCPPCAEFTRLWQRIDEFMPLRNPAACDASCARDIAAWIFNGFSTTPSCSIEFRYDSIDADRFEATVLITNGRGQDVPTWRLGWTLPPGHQLVSSRNAQFTETQGQIVLRPQEPTALIARGATLAIGLQGTHGGIVPVPTDLRLEAPPCFTPPPQTP